MGKPRALLTGSSGFTGRYLAPGLAAAGYDVIGLSGPESDADAGSLRLDLTNAAAIRAALQQIRPQVVVHLAGVSFVAHEDVGEIRRVNVDGTRNLLEGLSALPEAPRKVVLASSANVYGDAGNEPIVEECEPAPKNEYASSKLAMERMAQSWADRLPIVIVRPFNYTGIGQSPRFLIPKIVDHFRRGAQEIELGNLKVWRDFSDVRDIAALYVQLAQHAPPGETFNLCSGRAASLDEVLELMSTIAGYRIEVRVNQAFIREGEIEYLVGNHAKLARVLGGYPQRPLWTTLKWMFDTELPAGRSHSSGQAHPRGAD